MVLVVSIPPDRGGAPTSAVARGVPFAPSPWHIAHFAAKIGAPCAAVPLPGGRPVPSGRMLMSHAAISPGSIGLPRFGPTAEAVPAPRPSATTTAKRASLRVNMFHLPIALDRPTGNAVEVLA